MVEFRLFGIPVRVEVTFWITLGFLGFFWIGLHENGILLIGLFLLAAFFSVLIHEMGHALMIKKYRLPTQVVLSSFGGYATHPAGVLSRKQDFFVTFAGPASQLACGLVVLYATKYMGTPDNLAYSFVEYFITVSIIWSILNCLPILPLDGGRMLAAILGPRRIKAALSVSIISAVLVGCLAIWVGAMFGAIFMGLFAYQNIQAYKQHF